VGVGRALLEKAAENGREIGAEKLYWITKEDNAQARALYDSFVKGSATGFIQYEYSL
jgi:ribosomal protein S18 acetylase RimI-like enzyme